jgi:soluble lytic murein transglycosylase
MGHAAEHRRAQLGLGRDRPAGRHAPGHTPAGDALQYFAKVTKDTDLTDDMLGWKVRARIARRHQPNWPLVLAAVNAMSEDARKDPTWSYWKARALLATAPPDAAPKPVVVATTPGVAQTIPTGITISPQRAEALALLQSFASVRGFYEQLALEETGPEDHGTGQTRAADA